MALLAIVKGAKIESSSVHCRPRRHLIIARTRTSGPVPIIRMTAGTIPRVKIGVSAGITTTTAVLAGTIIIRTTVPPGTIMIVTGEERRTAISGAWESCTVFSQAAGELKG